KSRKGHFGMVLVILFHGQMTRMTLDPAPSFLTSTSTSGQREDV
ncbi:hypothetical protein AVEN_26731-1, partial [Araneus ventricosus]